MPQNPTPSDHSGPDHFLIGDAVGNSPPSVAEQRMPDSGPRYKETPADPYAPDAASIAEPWNTATAFLFVILVGYWVWRLRGRFREHVFLTACLPILFTGAVGGTLYHATRTSQLFFLLDVIPISILGLLAAVYLIVRLTVSVGVVRTGIPAIGLIIFYLFVNTVLFRLLYFPNPNLRVNLSYASLALLLLCPLLVVLVRTGFRHANWVWGALCSFSIAWFCRLVDNQPLGDLPMGTHWLWHIFGAVTTFAIMEYFYNLETEPIPDASLPGEPTAGAEPAGALEER